MPGHTIQAGLDWTYEVTPLFKNDFWTKCCKLSILVLKKTDTEMRQVDMLVWSDAVQYCSLYFFMLEDTKEDVYNYSDSGC